MQHFQKRTYVCCVSCLMTQEKLAVSRLTDPYSSSVHQTHSVSKEATVQWTAPELRFSYRTDPSKRLAASEENSASCSQCRTHSHSWHLTACRGVCQFISHMVYVTSSELLVIPRPQFIRRFRKPCPLVRAAPSCQTRSPIGPFFI
jgi:hypothetical protein